MLAHRSLSCRMRILDLRRISISRWAVEIGALQIPRHDGDSDASELAHLGAVNVGLAWPLRYSHSPAEVIDLQYAFGRARQSAVVRAHNQSRP